MSNPFIAITSSKANLAMGETTTLSFALSEASTNFTASDVTVVGGTIGLLCNTDAPAESVAPTVMISNTKARVKPGETDIITFTLSEASSNFTASDVRIIGGTLTNFTQSATNPLCKIDTTPPTIIVSADKSALAMGQTAVVTFTLSELATDFAASDITVMGGTLSGFAQSATNPDKSILKAADTATITFTLSEISTNFDASDIAVTGGTLSGFAQSASNPYNSPKTQTRTLQALLNSAPFGLLHREHHQE
eukprot:gene9325-10985_t